MTSVAARSRTSTVIKSKPGEAAAACAEARGSHDPAPRSRRTAPRPARRRTEKHDVQAGAAVCVSRGRVPPHAAMVPAPCCKWDSRARRTSAPWAGRGPRAPPAARPAPAGARSAEDKRLVSDLLEPPPSGIPPPACPTRTEGQVTSYVLGRSSAPQLSFPTSPWLSPSQQDAGCHALPSPAMPRHASCGTQAAGRRLSHLAMKPCGPAPHAGAPRLPPRGLAGYFRLTQRILEDPFTGTFSNGHVLVFIPAQSK